MPHSSALLTPTRAPHARLLKHWEGRIVSLLALVSHPHAYHKLACSLAGLHSSSLARFLSDSLLLLTLQLSLSFSFSSPSSFSHPFTSLASAFFSLLSPPLFSSERTSNSFYICGPSRRRSVRPKLTPPHLRTVTMTTRALSKKVGVGARERMLLRKIRAGFRAHKRTLLRKNKGTRQSS